VSFRDRPAGSGIGGFALQWRGGLAGSGGRAWVGAGSSLLAHGVMGRMIKVLWSITMVGVVDY